MESNEISKIETYLKYYCDSIIEKIFTDDGVSIRFSQPWILNDPFEFNPVIKFNQINEYTRYKLNGILLPSLNEWFRIQLIENKVNDFGVFSLTKNPFSFDMWNYYGNGHKGLLIEFKNNLNEQENFKSKDGQVYPIKEVIYVEEYIIDISKLSNNEGEFLDKDFNKQFFYTKTNRWVHEQEYRIVKALSDFGKQFQSKVNYREDNALYTIKLPFDFIKTITFGAHMSNTNKIKIIDKLRNTNIRFNQAFVIKDKKDNEGNWGKVIINPLNNSEIRTGIKKISPQVLSYEQKEMDETKEQTIYSLEELPYYNDPYMESVNEMYNNNLNLKSKN